MKNRSKFLIILVIFFFSFSFNVNIIKALPTCDTSFYNMSWYWDNMVSLGELHVELEEGDWGWQSSKKAIYAAYRVNKKNQFKDATVTIIEQRKDGTEKKVCQSTINAPQGIAKGDNITLHIEFNKNVSTNGASSCSTEGAEWKYGHIYQVEISGHFYNYTSGDGKVSSYEPQIQNIKRCGQYYNTNRTKKTTAATKKDGSIEKTTAEDKSFSGDYGDASDKIHSYTTKKQPGLTGDEEGTIQCDGDLKDLINKYWKWVTILSPIALMILIIFDFIKAIVSSNEDQLKKSAQNALKRTIAVIVLLLLPFILETILGWFGLELCL